MKQSALTIIVVIVFHFSNLAQQRIGIDLSSRLTNLTLTANYQKVIKNNWLISGGITLGALGRKYINIESDTILIKNGFTIQSPYSNLPTSVADTSGNNFQLINYNMNSTGFGAFVGIGFFKEFSIIHGIRFNLNSKFHCVQSRVHGGYFNVQNSYYTHSNSLQNYFVGSISPEIYHTIRLSGRSTFYYGVKVPYYFSIDKGRFRPSTTKELLSGFEFDLSVGMTFVIGKCD